MFSFSPAVFFFSLLCTAFPLLADDNAIGTVEKEAPKPPFKLTAAWYDFSDKSHGTDVNLRYSADVGNLWLGYFRLGDQGINQWRTGWDQTIGSTVRLLLSIGDARPLVEGRPAAKLARYFPPMVGSVASGTLPAEGTALPVAL